ncbi:hypothetical protein EYZ11_009515 [Aspergillus tanneri]|uniref:Uncharacterized protein n=1 Tax=Aspergillus tanneri TaxID=1220188 RepID=A0A4S3J7R1_9EURO|nr:hypothetical protein EYZ11_009515 [Aspergillus tanneri]
MSQQASVPQPGKNIQVIAPGLSRTATTSFSTALSILLDGPIHHGNGYIAAMDAPGLQVVPELMELHPKAIVICTAREPKAWVKSQQVAS